MTRLTGGLAALCLVACAGLAQAEGDAEKGEKVFRKCSACHSADAEGPKRTGPSLYGVVDRQIGSLEDFRYSEALSAAGAAGEIWSEAQLSAFLADPRSLFKGHKMAFAGLKKEDERNDVIAFLRSRSAQ